MSIKCMRYGATNIITPNCGMDIFAASFGLRQNSKGVAGADKISIFDVSNPVVAVRSGRSLSSGQKMPASSTPSTHRTLSASSTLSAGGTLSTNGALGANGASHDANGTSYNPGNAYQAAHPHP
jgi:hypothetical protein